MVDNTKTSEELATTIDEHVNEINRLSRIRAALAMGSNTGSRHSAESTLSRAINKRVEALSKIVLNNFDC
jgi:hypothetical protein